MAVIVQYIVEKDGIQKMTFDNKKDAEAYDKILDITADLWVMMEKANLPIDDKNMEELCMFLANNKDEAMAILKGSKPKSENVAKPVKAKTTAKEEKAKESKPAVEGATDNAAEKSSGPGKGKSKAA